jgi:ketosteroid isomerase-like protein
MSRDNVEIVRRSIEAWNERGQTTWTASLHPDAEIDWSRSRAPFKGVYRGCDGAETFWDVFWSTFEDVQVETHGFIEMGSEVVVPNTVHMRGREGIEVIARTALVFWVENGQITRLRLFQEQAEALEAAGLSEWENAEQRGLAEAGFAALNSGDLEAFLALTAEDVEFTSMVAEAEGTIFRGHDGVRAWWETIRGAFEDVHWELLDVRGSGDRGVMHFRMSGTLGSVPVEQAMWQAVVLRNSKTIWWAFFRTEREAVEAVGLRE